MKSKMKVMLSFILTLSLLLGSSVSAGSIPNSEENEPSSKDDLMLQYTYEPFQIEYPDGEVQAAGPLVGVAVFFAGVLVGYVVDGVVIYATGKSGGEWVATALNHVRSNPGCKQVNVTPLGHSYCGSSRSF
ncbi:hypothetical protein J2W91_004663 [Paenibacillus amylolyticus]|uniref:Uncharacterized protein n=1 Tax=Paenibacillus amylolyticus TaxID=1451 RepID=A0AAP5LNW6_PAEAM|nr:hypothetical protein [Paenibacillus amylolyticus]MDR6726157.1 hypothetical protein [Paenibacillus amylolyticus]